jgi:outer membrane protein assembly factor BamD (BamD/ComL family)
MRRLRKTVSIVLILCAAAAIYGQTSADTGISRGIGLFGAEKYSEALETFGRVLSDPGAAAYRADAVYWSAMSYLALGDVPNAQRSLNAFLKEYPRHANVPDALYQRARLFCMTEEYEESLRMFGSFLESYPSHPFVPSALYWTGDCLFSLGRLPEAESIFRTVIKDYPGSVKYEASNYKLSLIRYKYREDELLTLLKWSHEESLRVIEEFQRREKAYEQALSVYQRRLSDAGMQEPAASAAAPSASDSDARVAALNARIDELTRALAENDGGGRESSLPKEDLLELKAQALDLLESYIDWIALNAEKEAKP